MLERIIQSLAGTPEPGGKGSMLDNTLIVYTSDSGEVQHSHGNHWSFLLIGNLGGRIRSGRYIQFPTWGSIDPGRVIRRTGGPSGTPARWANDQRILDYAVARGGATCRRLQLESCSGRNRPIGPDGRVARLGIVAYGTIFERVWIKPQKAIVKLFQSLIVSQYSWRLFPTWRMPRKEQTRSSSKSFCRPTASVATTRTRTRVS